MVEEILYTIFEFLRLTITFGIIFLPFAYIAKYVKTKYVKKYLENEILSFVVSAHIVFFLVFALMFIYIQFIPGQYLYPVFEEFGMSLTDYIGLGIAKIVYWNITAFVWAILSAIFYFIYLFSAKYLDEKIQSELIRDLISFFISVGAFMFISILIPWIFIGIMGMLWTGLS